MKSGFLQKYINAILGNRGAGTKKKKSEQKRCSFKLMRFRIQYVFKACFICNSARPNRDPLLLLQRLLSYRLNAEPFGTARNHCYCDKTVTVKAPGLHFQIRGHPRIPKTRLTVSSSKFLDTAIWGIQGS